MKRDLASLLPQPQNYVVTDWEIPDLPDGAPVPEEWWHLLLGKLSCGQTLYDAFRWANYQTGFYFPWLSLRTLIDTDYRVKEAVEMAQVSRRMAARHTVGLAVEESVRDAQWYLDRTDRDFLPRGDVTTDGKPLVMAPDEAAILAAAEAIRRKAEDGGV